MEEMAPGSTARPVKTVLRPFQQSTVKDLLVGVHRRRGVTFTVMFPRQTGKNEASAAFVAGMLEMHANDGGTLVVCAPTLHPQAGISLERTLRWLRPFAQVAAEGMQVRAEGNILHAGRASAVFLSASPAAHVAGHTASLALVGDEAQDIESDWFDRQFRPMAASTGAPTVLFGTPWNGQTLLERAVARNLEVDERSPAGAVKLHHQFSWQEVAQCVPAYGAYVRSERARLGATHPLYTSQYELVAGDSAGRLFSAAQLEAMEGGHARLDAPVPGERYAAGLDVGGDGEGADATVLTIARAGGGRCEVVAHRTWRGVPFGVLEQELDAACREWHFDRLAVDSTGMGVVVAAHLEAAFGDAVERFTFTSPSKSELGFALRAAVETGRLRLYADDGSSEARECRQEIARCEARYPGRQQLAWSSNRGDDYVASLALCLRACDGIAPPRIAVGRRRL
jgi:hypothetical protein